MRQRREVIERYSHGRPGVFASATPRLSAPPDSFIVSAVVQVGEAAAIKAIVRGAR